MLRVDNAVFSETGPDTGVFFGVVKMSGQHFTVHDQNDSLVKGHGHTEPILVKQPVLAVATDMDF